MNYWSLNIEPALRTTISQKKIRIFTWHIHGSYLYYLSQGDDELYIPINETGNEGYYGLGETFPFGDNVHEIFSDLVKNLEFDCILFQANRNFLVDQYQILSPEQRELPKLYLEHDPPKNYPTDTNHLIDDPNMMLVHVTHYNKLMWDNSKTPACVIEHGVIFPEVTYTGELDCDLVVINSLPTRGRLLGLDIFLEVKKHIPLDLVGMGTESLGGYEVLHPQLPEFMSRYRFFFNPIRYTSLGLAVIEAMMVGLPVAGMDTTELSTVIRNGSNGYTHTDIYYLISKMKKLSENKNLASSMGYEGQRTALEKFNIQQFTDEWRKISSMKLFKADC